MCGRKFEGETGGCSLFFLIQLPLNTRAAREIKKSEAALSVLRCLPSRRMRRADGRDHLAGVGCVHTSSLLPPTTGYARTLRQELTTGHT